MPNEIDCPACLEDLNRSSACSNMSGVKELLYALQEDIQTWPAKAAIEVRSGLVDHIETASGESIVMKPGKKFFKLYSKRNAAELKYAIQGEAGSRSIKATLEIYHPSFRSKILGFMAATMDREMVMLVKTANGDYHLLGDADNGVEYDSAEATSGKAVTDANGATITLSHDMQAPTIYKGDVSSLLVVGGTVATIVTNNETVVGTAITLSGLCTVNDSTVTKVGFRYRKEGENAWTTVSMSSFVSGTAFTKNVTGTAGDYMFYAFMVIDGQEVYGETKACKIE